MTAPDVYLVAAEAATAALHSKVPHHAAMLAHFDWFIAAIDAAVAFQPPRPAPIAVLPPKVLKQAAVTR